MPLTEINERGIAGLQRLVEPHLEAHIIQTDDEAIAVARQVAKQLASGAAERDENRRLPFDEIDDCSHSGLWGITVPKEHGGAGVNKLTLARVIAIIAEGDPSIAQIAQSHFGFVEDLGRVGTDEQKRFFFDRVLKGDRAGNAFSEPKGKTVADMKTKLTPTGDSDFLVNGEKFYCTGALFAHWVFIFAVDSNGKGVFAIVDRNTEGLTIVNDWSGIGQRTTASGTVRAVDVRIQPEQVLWLERGDDRPNNGGTYAQLIHAAIDLGIARAALEDTIGFVKTKSRPWVDAHVERAADDPLTIAQIGDLEYQVHAAEAMLDRAARLLDRGNALGTVASADAATIAVAEAKIATTEIALLASSKLFELAGTRAALDKYDFDRHWRNARTHTLHDPVRWKYYAVGDYYLNGIAPSRHAWI